MLGILLSLCFRSLGIVCFLYSYQVVLYVSNVQSAMIGENSITYKLLHFEKMAQHVFLCECVWMNCDGFVCV